MVTSTRTGQGPLCENSFFNSLLNYLYVLISNNDLDVQDPLLQAIGLKNQTVLDLLKLSLKLSDLPNPDGL